MRCEVEKMKNGIRCGHEGKVTESPFLTREQTRVWEVGILLLSATVSGIAEICYADYHEYTKLFSGESTFKVIRDPGQKLQLPLTLNPPNPPPAQARVLINTSFSPILGLTFSHVHMRVAPSVFTSQVRLTV